MHKIVVEMPKNSPLTRVMSLWLRSLPDLLCFVKDSRLENLLLRAFFLGLFFFCEPAGAVGRKALLLSDGSSAWETSGTSGGASSSSLLREKIPAKLFQKEGFLFFFDFLVGFSGSSSIVSGGFEGVSTAENVPIPSSFSPSVK